MKFSATGRLTSLEPNLQNIPVRTETGQRIRNAFLRQDCDQTGKTIRHLLAMANFQLIYGKKEK